MFFNILDQSRLEDVVLIVWEEEQSISGCHREETTGGKQKGNPENQPLGNQTFSALMDFQGCMEHKRFYTGSKLKFTGAKFTGLPLDKELPS